MTIDIEETLRRADEGIKAAGKQQHKSVEFIQKFFKADSRVLLCGFYERDDPRADGGVFRYFDWNDLDITMRWIKTHNESGRNIYFSHNPFKDEYTARKKAKKQNIAAVSHLHLDVDPPKGCKDIAAWREEFRKKLPILKLLTPTWHVDSGRGYWFFFELTKPEGDITAAELRNQGLIEAAGDDGDGSTWNADRIARLPGTTNHKSGQLATVLEHNPDRSYTLTDFALPTGKSKSKSESRANGKAKLDDINLEELRLSDDLVKVIREGCYDRWGNDRSRAVFYVACQLLKQNVPEQKIIAIFLEPSFEIGAHVREQRNPRRYAERQVDSAKVTVENSFVMHQGKPIGSSQHNVRVGLKKLGITVGFNEFSLDIELAGLDGYTRIDDSAINTIWIELDKKFEFRPTKGFLTSVLEYEARQDAYHPVRDYLAELRWDGVPRIDTWLIDYAGAVDSAYVRAVSKLILLAAVRRVRQPGCKFDELPVFESDTQGTDKSTAIAALAVKDAWFTDHIPLNADPKIVIEQTAGVWIAEAGELSGLKRGDIDKLKGMLSRRVDKARLAYGRLTTEVPRQFIMIGTTNSRSYLKDQTGNRRFWPVRIGVFNTKQLKQDRDQLWAEAATREAKGESIRLDPSLWEAAGVEQAERTAADPWRETLENYLGEYNDAKIHSEDVWKLLKSSPERRDQHHFTRMGDAMRVMGWERPKSKIRIQGRHAWGYRIGAGKSNLVVVVPRPEPGEPLPDPYVYDTNRGKPEEPI